MGDPTELTLAAAAAAVAAGELSPVELTIGSNAIDFSEIDGPFVAARCGPK